jgi:hypothetical protein
MNDDDSLVLVIWPPQLLTFQKRCQVFRSFTPPIFALFGCTERPRRRKGLLIMCNVRMAECTGDWELRPREVAPQLSGNPSQIETTPGLPGRAENGLTVSFEVHRDKESFAILVWSPARPPPKKSMEVAWNGPSQPSFNPFTDGLRASLTTLAPSDPSVTREAQGGRGHGVSGDRAVQRDHGALS